MVSVVRNLLARLRAPPEPADLSISPGEPERWAAHPLATDLDDLELLYWERRGARVRHLGQGSSLVFVDELVPEAADQEETMLFFRGCDVVVQTCPGSRFVPDRERPYLVLPLHRGWSFDKIVGDSELSAARFRRIARSLLVKLESVHRRDRFLGHLQFEQVIVDEADVVHFVGPPLRFRGGRARGSSFDSMAREQIRGLPLEPASDIASAGILLLGLCAGVRPFLREGDFATLEAARNLEPDVEPRPGLSAFSSLLQRMLAREPGDRISAAAAVEALEALELEDHDGPEPPITRQPAWPPSPLPTRGLSGVW